ncbi:MAG TPA: M1 family aminopeptidase [Pyrinomonadaceae bacterium]|nr:M1 family aminopeptidase [Pyrinomonadaceae bacterium]
MKRAILNISCSVILLLFGPLLFATSVVAQADLSASGKQLYSQLKSFSLGGTSVTVNALTFNRDRAQMTFSGTFYFAAPVEGRVTGAVFVGKGRIRVEVPPNDFEKENLKRLLGINVVESDFDTAVMRFSDDTFERFSEKTAGSGVAGPPDAGVQKLATEMEERILKETGANLSARVALSILNREKPGFFFANFDGGDRGRFSLMLDYQNRIPVANFRLNAGEKGLLFHYDSGLRNNDIWMAFYSQEDYQRGAVGYSDLNDIINVNNYELDLDLREHKKNLRLHARLQSENKFANTRAITFSIGESLGEEENTRLKKQMRLQRARLGTTELSFAQEDWEGGFTVFLPAPVEAGKKVELEFTLDGDFMHDGQLFIDRYYYRFFAPHGVIDSYYPRSTTSWYPRHGYLDRSTFNMTFRHPKKLRIASIGSRLSEEADAESKDGVITRYEMKQPVALATFAMGPFERHKQVGRWDQGGSGEPVAIEFNSLPGSIKAIKEDFVLAELDNSLRYFSVMFGKYPYPVFGAAYHPFFFGQGFPSMLMMPAEDSADVGTYSFIAHETAHQWWGNIVLWRSYRDQWLSEGFAEYSGILYTGLRAGAGKRDDLINLKRSRLKLPPQTLTGPGKGRLVDVGPIILGHRLNTQKTFGAYQTLIYDKGALVLRMLHFLFTDPATGDGEPFFAMMRDFVNRHRDGVASTDDFRLVANEHFIKTPIARMYRMTSLDWFFSQWVYQSDLPSYRMEYQLQDQPDGKVLLTGNVIQEGAPNDWFMVLPVGLSFGGKQTVITTVAADGPKAPFSIKLPMRPTKVDLDPDRWVLSENTSTKRN